MKNWIVEKILKFRLVFILMGIVLTIFFIYESVQLKLQDDPNKWPPKSHPYVVLNEQIQDIFGGANVVTIQVEVKNGDIFNKETLGKIKRISDKVLLMDGAVSYYLTSLSARKIKYMRGTDDFLDISFLMEFAPNTQEEIDRIKWGVYHNPTLFGSLMSIDSKATLIICDFRLNHRTTLPKIYKEIKNICEEENDDNHIITYAGTPIIIGWVNSEGVPSIILAFFLFLIAMGVILWLAFKRVIAIILPLGLGLIASIWGLGLQKIFLGEVLHSASGFLVPFIVMAAATCHSVQFLKRFFDEEYTKVKESKAAIVNTFDALFFPIVLSLATDISAFVVCAFIPFANVSTVGSLTTFGLSSVLMCIILLFIPLLFYFPGTPKKLDLGKREGISYRVIKRTIQALVENSNARWIVTVCLVVILIISLTIIPKIDVGQDNTYAIHNFLTKSWEKNSIYQMEMNIKNRFHSIFPFNLLIETDKTDGLKDPEVLKKIDQLAAFLEKKEYIGGIMHLATFMKVMHRFLHAEDDKYFIVPKTKKAICEYLYLYDLSDPGSFDFLIDHDYKRTLLVAYADNTSHKTVNEILKTTKEYIQSQFNDDKVVAKMAGGIIGIMGAFNESVARWIVLATLLSALASFVVVFILFRSLIAPIFLLIPLILATVIWYAVMYLSGIEINSNASTSVAMAMGVGIDAELYLLYRFREEFARDRDFNRAFIESFTKIRKALIFSHFSLTFGCWSVIFIPLYIGYVGYGMGMIILICFLISLLLPPILWTTFKPKFLFK